LAVLIAIKKVTAASRNGGLYVCVCAREFNSAM